MSGTGNYLTRTKNSLNAFMKDFRYGLLIEEFAYYYTESATWFTGYRGDPIELESGHVIYEFVTDREGFYMSQISGSSDYVLTNEYGERINEYGIPILYGDDPIILKYNNATSTDGTSLYDVEKFDPDTGYGYRDEKKPNYSGNPYYFGETMWEYIFVGGTGGKGLWNAFDGGTPYTSRIIGTQHIDAALIGDEFYAYTRDDVVTRAGKFCSAFDFNDKSKEVKNFKTKDDTLVVYS